MHITPNTSSSLVLIKSKTLVILQPETAKSCMFKNKSIIVYGHEQSISIFPRMKSLISNGSQESLCFLLMGGLQQKICRTISPARNTQGFPVEQLTVFSQASVANLLEVCLYHRTSCEEVPIGSV